MTEILTIDELAAFLKLTRSQIYSMTRARAQARMENPLPIVRINGNIRFVRSEVEAWIQKLTRESAA